MTGVYVVLTTRSVIAPHLPGNHTGTQPRRPPPPGPPCGTRRVAGVGLLVGCVEVDRVGHSQLALFDPRFGRGHDGVIGRCVQRHDLIANRETAEHSSPLAGRRDAIGNELQALLTEHDIDLLVTERQLLRVRLAPCDARPVSNVAGASASIAGLRSEPTDRPTNGAAVRAMIPVPQATSSTRSPDWGAVRRTTSCARGSNNSFTLYCS